MTFSPRPSKILLVDDDPLNLDILCEYLETTDHTILQAANGRIAWNLMLQHKDIDVVLLDRMMPEMDGMELTQLIKQERMLKHIPIIMQTAASSSQQILEGLQSGVFYYLTKPYNKHTLMSLVNAALSDACHVIDPVVPAGQLTLAPFLTQGHFEFSTPIEAEIICGQIAHFFSDPHKALTGLYELAFNAIEHGNLGFHYEEKQKLILFGAWSKAVEKRLKEDEHKHKKVQLKLAVKEEDCIVTIRDEGNGFTPDRFMDIDPSRIQQVNGRGIAIANRMSFERLEYLGNGNEVRAASKRAKAGKQASKPLLAAQHY